jgi:thiol-disulfide isomerase/thioredoxin
VVDKYNEYAITTNAARSGQISFDSAKVVEKSTLDFYYKLFKDKENEDFKDYLALEYFNISGSHNFTKPEFLHDEINKYLLNLLKSNSDLWQSSSLSWNALALARHNNLDIINNDLRSGLEKSHPSVAEKYDYRLLGGFLRFDKDTSKAEKYFEEFKSNYPDSEFLEYLEMDFKFDKDISVGKMLPDFEIKSMDGNEIYTNESLKGKYILVDFWATWCPPCIAEMDNLHQVHKKFGGYNFEIFSLSFDRSPEEVEKFVKNPKNPMPWLHSFVENGYDNELSKAFEVDGIPKPILIDPDGKIIATEVDLRGERLEKTLAKFLED